MIAGAALTGLLTSAGSLRGIYRRNDPPEIPDTPEFVVGAMLAPQGSGFSNIED
jgi:hypothetical protein